MKLNILLIAITTGALAFAGVSAQMTSSDINRIEKALEEQRRASADLIQELYDENTHLEKELNECREEKRKENP